MKETIGYQNIQGNRKHKDLLFRKVFRKKSDLLALYNAINGTAKIKPVQQYIAEDSNPTICRIL